MSHIPKLEPAQHVEYPFTNLPGHEGRRGFFMHISTGKHPYFPCDPRVEEVHIEDIAHGLANQCRFNGQTNRFYSTAEHSYWCSRFGPPKEALERLMHDAAEAYIGDIIRPIKYLKGFGETYLELEKLNEKVIAQRFGLTYPWPASVKIADEAVCTTEMDHLIASKDKGHLHDGSNAAHFRPACWEPSRAKILFLDRFEQLTRKRREAA